MSEFRAEDFIRIAFNIPSGGLKPPMRWWECQDWLLEKGHVAQSNKAYEFDEMRPGPERPNETIWWDYFTDEDEWSWYFPVSQSDLATLFKLTWAGK